MQIVVLAGGMATRMRPMTDTMPKAMIPVAGKPFFQHQIELFKKNNITDIVACIGYKGEQITKHFGNGSKFGVSIKYSNEWPNLMGTAGALKKVENLLKDEFMVIYGDSYLTIDYQEVMRHFRDECKNSKKAKALCTVYKNQLAYHPNNMKIENGLIVKYDKKNPTPDMKHVDYGLSIFKKEIISALPAGKVIQLDQLLQDLIKKKELLAYVTNQRFYEIGEPEGMKQLEALLKLNSPS